MVLIEYTFCREALLFRPYFVYKDIETVLLPRYSKIDVTITSLVVKCVFYPTLPYIYHKVKNVANTHLVHLAKNTDACMCKG